MNRITEKMLEIIILDINKMTGNTGHPYKKRRAKNGSLVANAGAFVLSHSYGGVSLHRMSKGGGVSDVFRCGHTSKRELYGMVCAMRDTLFDVQSGVIKIKRVKSK